MGLLDQVLSAAGNLTLNQGGEGHSIVDAITQLINNPQVGGLTGLVQAFETGGLGQIVQSWVSTGQNLPISAEQIQSVLGNEQIQSVASKLGLSTDEISGKLAEYLPQVVDKLTPDGNVHAGEELLAQGFELLKGRLFS